MSLSLSSLLNPSDGGNDSPLHVRRDSQPLPEEAHHHERSGNSPPEVPSVTRSQWHIEQKIGERSTSYEQRPGSSGQIDPIQLPPPTTTGRKMSSPTLEQYQVASRSPEQRRASMASPVPSNITLPPLQGFATPSHRPSRELATLEEHESSRGASHATQSYVDTSAAFGPPLVAHDPHGPLEADSTASSSGAVQPRLNITDLPATETDTSSTYIKQENLPTPQTSSPPDHRHSSYLLQEPDMHTQKQVAALKTENTLRNSSPLRESSVPMPSTETVAQEPGNSKKRPAPARIKKGTAVMTKKAPAAKKRKIDANRSSTPSSRVSKTAILKGASGKNTPANSSPAPSTRSQSADPEDEAYDEDDDDEVEEDDYDADGDVYCICRKPDTGTFMIGCDGTCDDWFHGKCVSIDERDKNLIDKYVCPNCTKAGIGRTIWKRMCRRSGCRQPARIVKSKNGRQGSKYCSDECGVLYLRDTVARTRGREDLGKQRSSRRKTNLVDNSRRAHDDDLGPLGGALSAVEIKSLVDSVKTSTEFQRLGEGVLSPPTTPEETYSGIKPPNGFSESEQAALDRIFREKEAARHKHQLLKDRMQFITMVKKAAARTATERDLKPKEFCGFDSRIQWTEDQFAAWRNSSDGKHALELDTLANDKAEDAMDIDAATNPNIPDDLNLADYEVCDRKKCARHLEWPKLAVDDLRFEMSDNGDRMRALDREERDVREQAILRAKKMDAGGWIGEGSVEVHLYTTPVITDLQKISPNSLSEKVGADGGMDVDQRNEVIEEPSTIPVA